MLLLGIDEGTDRLFNRNPSALWKEYAASIGTTAGKLTDAQKQQALLSAALLEGAKVGGEYERFLGTAPSFLPHATEAVWELAEHRFVYILESPEHAGHGLLTVFLADLDTRVGDIPFFKGRGCDECSGTGLRGRQGLYEVMMMTPALRKLILHNVGAQEIKDAAIDAGMLTLRMDGWLKVLKGITTMEQVIRETSV